MRQPPVLNGRHPCMCFEVAYHQAVIREVKGGGYLGVAELMNSTSTSLESVYTGAIMHWGMMTLSIQNIVAIIGSMTGCLFCLWWMKMLRLPYTRLLTIGFGFLLVYQVCMYFYITPTLNFERLIFPTFIRTFGYAIFFTTLTLSLEELMPFQHFFSGFCSSVGSLK